MIGWKHLTIQCNIKISTSRVCFAFAYNKHKHDAVIRVDQKRSRL